MVRHKAVTNNRPRLDQLWPDLKPAHDNARAEPHFPVLVHPMMQEKDT